MPSSPLHGQGLYVNVFGTPGPPRGEFFLSYLIPELWVTITKFPGLVGCDPEHRMQGNNHRCTMNPTWRSIGSAVSGMMLIGELVRSIRGINILGVVSPISRISPPSKV